MIKVNYLAILKVILACMLIFSLPAIETMARGNGNKVAYSGQIVATAFNSLEGQTDSTPWITASGTRCREGVIASNFLPMGTKVLIEGFGNRIFTVEDRMNRRYTKRIDIWFRHYSEARNFGIRKVKYYVLASN